KNNNINNHNGINNFSNNYFTQHTNQNRNNDTQSVVSFFPNDPSMTPIMPFYNPYDPSMLPMSSMPHIPRISDKPTDFMDTPIQPIQSTRTANNVSRKRHRNTLTNNNLFEFNTSTIQEPAQKKQKVSNHSNFGSPINFLSNTSGRNGMDQNMRLSGIFCGNLQYNNQ
ncbi:MAG: hypothetical protein GY782_07225, partial [Gammaproteobacteria bacterium]|nr:hypothetical protein [Gammaproteobacteria bacterium]